MFVSNTAGALKSSKFLILMLPVSTLILTIMLEIEYKHIYLQFRKLATVGGGVFHEKSEANESAMLSG